MAATAAAAADALAAIPLYKLHASTGRVLEPLEMTDAASRALGAMLPQQLDKLKVLGLVGLARQGKSTELMLMLRLVYVDKLWGGVLGGPTKDEVVAFSRDPTRWFARGADAKTVTAGVWLLNRALPLPPALGGGHLLLVDTEGADRGDDNVVAKLMAATCMLTSGLVSMTKKQLLSSDLEAMSRLVTCLQAGCGDTPETKAIFANASPKLFWQSTWMADEWLTDQALLRPLTAAEAKKEKELISAGEPVPRRVVDWRDKFPVGHADAGKIRAFTLLDRVLEDHLVGDGGRVIKTVFPSRAYVISREPYSEAETDALKESPPRLVLDGSIKESLEAAIERIIKETGFKDFGAAVASGVDLVERVKDFTASVNANKTNIPSVLADLHMARAVALLDEAIERLRTLSRAHAAFTTTAEADAWVEREQLSARALLMVTFAREHLVASVIDRMATNWSNEVNLLKLDLRLTVARAEREALAAQIEELQRTADRSAVDAQRLEGTIMKVQEKLDVVTAASERLREEYDRNVRALNDLIEEQRIAYAALERQQNKKKKKWYKFWKW